MASETHADSTTTTVSAAMDHGSSRSFSKTSIIPMMISTLAIVSYVAICAVLASNFHYVSLPVVDAARTIRFASPLTSLTIPDRVSVDDDGTDNDNTLTTPRSRFLPKWMAGLTAEKDARTEVAAKRSERLVSESDVSAGEKGEENWASLTMGRIRKQRQQEDKEVEQAFDKAVGAVEERQKQDLQKRAMALKKKMPKNRYQFVGVVDSKQKRKKQKKKDSGDVITWYARPKPTGDKWSVRLVHVNQQAIVKDLFARGKIDIFAKYTNHGVPKPPSGDSDDGVKQHKVSPLPIVKSKYEVRKRSWRNLWNFSPKHYFTDSSGMYWRERRLPSGMYTDGLNVYETSYRYKDGRNGMHPLGTLSQFLSSKSFTDKEKATILKKLQSAEPDIVLEL